MRLVPCGSEQCLADVTDALQMSVVFFGSPGCVVDARAPAALSQKYGFHGWRGKKPYLLHISEQAAKTSVAMCWRRLGVGLAQIERYTATAR